MGKLYPRRLTIMLPVPLIEMVEEWALENRKYKAEAFRSILGGKLVGFYRDKDFGGSFYIKHEGYKILQEVDEALKKRLCKKVLIELPTIVYEFIKSRAEQTEQTITQYVMKALIQELVQLR